MRVSKRRARSNGYCDEQTYLRVDGYHEILSMIRENLQGYECGFHMLLLFTCLQGPDSIEGIYYDTFRYEFMRTGTKTGTAAPYAVCQFARPAALYRDHFVYSSLEIGHRCRA